ncbi:MAG: hypothetical protein GEU90_10485 [Gemmatimonas sp.]|nr:hypothetical protein [Gemmatimonas sp.]
MKQKLPLLLMFLLATGCGRPASLEGPAPEGALDCALAYADIAGYQLVDGGSEDGFLRLIQRIEADPADARPVRAQPDPADQPTIERVIIQQNELLVQVDRDRVLFTVIREVDLPPERGSSATDQARTMLEMCTISPPTFPETQDVTNPPPAGAPL